MDKCVECNANVQSKGNLCSICYDREKHNEKLRKETMKIHYGFMNFKTESEIELLFIDQLEKAIMKELKDKEFPVYLRNSPVSEPIHIKIEQVKFTIINQNEWSAGIPP